MYRIRLSLRLQSGLQRKIDSNSLPGQKREQWGQSEATPHAAGQVVPHHQRSQPGSRTNSKIPNYLHISKLQNILSFRLQAAHGQTLGGRIKWTSGSGSFTGWVQKTVGRASKLRTYNYIYMYIVCIQQPYIYFPTGWFSVWACFVLVLEGHVSHCFWSNSLDVLKPNAVHSVKSIETLADSQVWLSGLDIPLLTLSSS